jgi:hypothetical protein
VTVARISKLRPNVMRTFVQIPAYRDPELPATLLDLYGAADQPDELRTCVLWQRADDESLPREVRELPNLEIIEVGYRESRGANWARAQLQSRWEGEPYTLLLDSHHRFVRGWDTHVLEMYRQCEARSKKPLLTAYLPAYDPAADPYARVRWPTKVYPFEYDAGVLARFTSFPIPFWESLEEPVEADFLSLHFVFAAGEFNAEVRFDPGVYYLKDEVVASVQAYTWGYDLFHPHRVFAWHCYDRVTRRPHYEDHEDWHAPHHLVLDKMRRLYSSELRDGDWIGPARSVDDFESWTMTKLVTSDQREPSNAQ